MNPILRHPLIHAKLKLKTELLRTVAILQRLPYVRGCIHLLRKSTVFSPVTRGLIQWARESDLATHDVEKKISEMSPQARQIFEKLKLKISEGKVA